MPVARESKSVLNMPLNPLILVVKGLKKNFSLVDLLHKPGHLNFNSSTLPSDLQLPFGCDQGR